ncbi:MAG: glycosyltransferase [Gammaproteobacteria bacterium]|nr:glycosyltransferase [Gammaproteobacteria bacterium]MDH3768986.1 glycosyltransferase [Gammaproteobacteria bacterium]
MSSRHLLHVFPTYCAAGPQVRAATLMRGLGAKYRHTVVAMDGRTGAADLADDTDLQLVDFASGPGPGSAARFFRKLLQEQAPDLLLSYNWGAIDAVIAARSVGMRRIVHHEDGFNVDEAQRLKLRRNWTRRLVLQGVDTIVPSRRLERIGREKWRLQRLHFIPNGIDASVFNRDPHLGAAFRESLGIPADAVVVGTVGHLRKVKNFGRLLRVFSAAEYSPMHLVIVGDGSERGGLETEAGSIDSLVHFTGHLSDLRAAYSAFDVFALSSDSEQQPVSLLEAMAASLPVCATDVGDVKASLPGSAHDYIVSLGPTVEATMADGLTRLAGDRSRRQALGAENRQHVEQYYSDIAMLSAYEKVYAAALSR